MEILLYVFVIAVLALAFLEKDNEKLTVIAVAAFASFAISIIMFSANAILPLVFISALCAVAVASSRYAFRAISTGIYLVAALFLCSSKTVCLGPVIWPAVILLIVLAIHRYGDNVPEDSIF